jgi:hypothetical protein
LIRRHGRFLLLSLVFIISAQGGSAARDRNPLDRCLESLRTHLHYAERKIPHLGHLLTHPVRQRMLLWSTLARRRARPIGTRAVALAEISSLHPVNNMPAAEQALEKRVKRLLAFREEMGEEVFTQQMAQQVIPSVDEIQVAHDPIRNRYITLQGVGRIEALRRAYGDDLRLEVKVFALSGALLDRLWKVREDFGLK